MSEKPEKTVDTETFSCLVVEDDAAFASLVMEVLRAEGGDPTHCPTLVEASAASDRKAFDLILLDNHLPDGRAYNFFDRLSRRNPDAPVIMITGSPDLAEAIALTRNGLFDYLTKPVETEELAACIRRARLRLCQNFASPSDNQCLGESPVMREVVEQLRQAARHPTATVLLTGESGAGKDAAARTLHRLTYEASASPAPYIALNCAALPAEMFEAELFGAERGAYTGADKRRLGLATAAQGGTLFLDEIAEVPLPVQAKLLRFLEGREFRPLGSTANQSFTGRFVSATNKSLHDQVRAGSFREDLLFRLEVFTVEIPPLRRRREDIPALAEHLLHELARKYGRPVPLLRSQDLAALNEYAFPGNVRELRNILERALLRTPDEIRWLALNLACLKSARLPDASPMARPNALLDASTNTLLIERKDLTPLEAQEYRLIRSALIESKGGIRRTATKVGLSPQALLRRLEKWPELRVDPR